MVKGLGQLLFCLAESLVGLQQQCVLPGYQEPNKPIQVMLHTPSNTLRNSDQASLTCNSELSATAALYILQKI